MPLVKERTWIISFEVLAKGLKDAHIGSALTLEVALVSLPLMATPARGNSKDACCTIKGNDRDNR